MKPDDNLRALFAEFVSAADAKDIAALVRLIRGHPELHDHAGEEGSLLDVIRWRCREAFEAAFAAGLSPDAGPASPDQTLLQHAAADDDVALVRLCLRYGADVERRNCEGETALGYAASWASLAIVRSLIEAGANVNNIEGAEPDRLSTALDAADKRPEISAFLSEHGAKTYAELEDCSS